MQAQGEGGESPRMGNPRRPHATTSARTDTRNEPIGGSVFRSVDIGPALQAHSLEAQRDTRPLRVAGRLRRPPDERTMDVLRARATASTRRTPRLRFATARPPPATAIQSAANRPTLERGQDEPRPLVVRERVPGVTGQRLQAADRPPDDGAQDWFGATLQPLHIKGL